MGGVKEMKDNRITGIVIQAPLLSSQQFFFICLQMLRPIKILQFVLDRSQVCMKQWKQLRYHESPLKHLTGKLDKLVTLLLCPPKACSCKTTYFNLDFWNCLAGPSTSGGKSLSSVSWWCIEQQLTKQDA